MNQRSKSAPGRSQPGWKKRLLFSSVAIAAGLATLEGLCSIAWLIQDYRRFRQELPTAVQFREEFHTRHDAEIGWVNIPGTHIPDFYGPGRPITINADGFRGLADYVGSKSPDRLRLICLGDSFTLGYGVGDRDAYPAQLESIHPESQVVNMGQGGYSIGQCYLWYLRDGEPLEGDAVVFAFILDDIWRMGEGRLANGAAAPGFEVRSGELFVTGQPLPPPIPTGSPIVDRRQTADFVIEHSALFRTAQTVVGAASEVGPRTDRQEKFRVALRIIEELHRHAADHGTPLLLVLLPELRELLNMRDAETYRAASALLQSFARDHGIPFLDVYDEFADAGPGQVESYFLTEHWHHYSERGNQLVARRLHSFLSVHLPGYVRSDVDSELESTVSQ